MGIEIAKTVNVLLVLFFAYRQRYATVLQTVLTFAL